MKWNKRFVFGTLSAVLMGAGLYLRTAVHWDNKLIGDEEVQWTEMQRPLADIVFQREPYQPEGFVGDFVLLWPFAHFSANPWVARIPHIVLTLVGFYLFTRVCRKELKSMEGWCLALALFMFNWNAVLHAFQIRPYGALPTLALLAYLCMERVVTASDWRAKDYAGCWAVFILLVLFHALGIVIFGAFLTYLALREVSRENVVSLLKRIFLRALPPVLAVFPLWSFYSRQMYRKTQVRDTFNFMEKSFKGFVSFVFGNLGDLQIRFLWAVPLLLVLAGLAVNDDLAKSRRLKLAVLFLLPITLLFLSDLRSHYFWVPRQFMWLIPFYAILVAQSVEAFMRAPRKSL